MLNKRQIIDSKVCEKIEEQGEEMDCMTCSCNICLAQVPTDNESGIKIAIKLLNSLLGSVEQQDNSLNSVGYTVGTLEGIRLCIGALQVRARK